MDADPEASAVKTHEFDALADAAANPDVGTATGVAHRRSRIDVPGEAPIAVTLRVTAIVAGRVA